MNRRLALPSLVFLAIGALPAAGAQDLASFPLQVSGEPGVQGSLELAPVPGAYAALLGLRFVRMNDVPLPSGGLVDLVLERVEFDFGRVGVHVDGALASWGWDSGDLSMWRGVVSGDPGSEVTLGFSSLGSYGWIRTAGEFTHLMARPDAAGGWSNARARFVPESVLDALGRPTCMADTLTQIAQPLPGAPSPNGGGVGGGVTLECPIAVETDWQLYQRWGNLAAEQNYVFMLLAAVSGRYDQQIDVVLTYPYVMFYTTPNDPWTTQETGGGTGALLSEFQSAWSGQIPANAALGHFVSGANLGGGIAYLDVLCSSNGGFGVSANINGGASFPVSQGSNTWDFVVISHELGHNFSSPHTWTYNPPIDTCPNPCINYGTVMSYCHTCGGGMNNITTYFHQRAADRMRQAAESSCLAPLGCPQDPLEDNDQCFTAVQIPTGTSTGLNVHTGDRDFYRTILAPGGAVDVTLSFAHASGNLDMFAYLDDCQTPAGSSTSLTDGESMTLVNTTPGLVGYVFEVSLTSGADCNHFDMDVVYSGTPPCGMPEDPLEPNDSCPGAASLSPGIYLGNVVHKSDPDYFSVTVQDDEGLTADLLFPSAVGNVDVALYLQGDCAGNPLAQGVTNTDDESLHWRNTTGISQTVVLAVTVRESSFGDCNLYDLALDVEPPRVISGAFCEDATANSSGFPARLVGAGGGLLGANDLELFATRLPPGQFGYFLASLTPGFVPTPGGSLGNLCLGGGDIARFSGQAQSSGAAGAFSLVIDMNAIPTNPPQAVQAGQVWYYQAWFRDVGNTSNFTGGASILYLF